MVADCTRACLQTPATNDAEHCDLIDSRRAYLHELVFPFSKAAQLESLSLSGKRSQSAGN
jgi:hypothetical protein